ncbi:unnamed protein product [Prorocentrum cordatum]|uniref:Uncharacterized protein n=1 Tax=Prorocentrum cordatum TaxID=2364126 RepID=A0ABN9WEJ2_9DINO|nr:unnamed protein product [Polarella glacialis]
MFGAFGKRVKSHCLCRRAASLGYNDQPDAAQRCRQHDVEEASQQSTQCQSPRKERLQLREMMRVFVQEAVNGKSLEAGDRGCEAELNPEGSLSLSEEEVDGATHDIPITDIKDVYGGTSVARLCAEAAPVRLDERCATLALRTAESASPSACPASESGRLQHAARARRASLRPLRAQKEEQARPGEDAALRARTCAEQPAAGAGSPSGQRRAAADR